MLDNFVVSVLNDDLMSHVQLCHEPALSRWTNSTRSLTSMIKPTWRTRTLGI